MDPAIIDCFGGLGNVLWQWSSIKKKWQDSGSDSLILQSGVLRAQELKDKWLNFPVCSNPARKAFAKYYQSPEWLLPPEEYCELFKPSVLKTQACQEALDAKLVIHVRGADFKRSPHHLKSRQTGKTVTDALRRLNLGALTKGDIVIVTDDEEEAASVTKLDPIILSVADPVQAWANMYYAKNLLISPGSTFSWWAGYLGKHDNVFMPVGTWPCDFGHMAFDETSVQSSFLLLPPKIYRTCLWHCCTA